MREYLEDDPSKFCEWKDCTFTTCGEKQQLCVMVRDRNIEDKV